MNSLTKSAALSVSLLMAAHANASDTFQNCNSENFAARTDLSSMGTGKIHFNVKNEEQFPHALEGYLEGTFNAYALKDLMLKYCENGTLSLDTQPPLSDIPVRRIELNSADNKTTIDITNRVNNKSDFSFSARGWDAPYKGNDQEGHITLESVNSFLQTGLKPAF